MIDYHINLLDSLADALLFSEFYKRYHRKSCGVAMGILGNPHDAEDAAMDTWERVAMSFHTAKDIYLYNPRPIFEGWLITIVKNLAKDQARKRKVLDRIVNNWAATRGSTAETEREFLEIMDMIYTMPDKIRIVLELRLIYGFRFAAMGRELGCSENAARMRYNRALPALKERLREEGYECPA